MSILPAALPPKTLKPTRVGRDPVGRDPVGLYTVNRVPMALAVLLVLNACSVLPEDIRATLPESMRGDTQALKDYPTPDLAGRWVDTDFPELAISMKQSGTGFTFTRSGSYREIPVKAAYTGTLAGRAVKISYQADYPGQLRPTEGQCFGVASKDSAKLELTCEDNQKGTFPMNLKKS